MARKLAQLQARKARRLKWTKARKAEVGFASSLKQVARTVGSLVQAYTPADPTAPGATEPMRAALTSYSALIEPWARKVAAKMIADVDRVDLAIWQKHSQEIGRQLRTELRATPIGAEFRERMADQVSLIKSLPLKAAQRVHRLTEAALVTGERADTVAKKILETGKVTASRAQLIARTEVARTASTLMQTRASALGSEGYIWRTAEDSDVRHSHAKMDGRYVRWSEPPTLDNMTGHAGEFPNCRCYPEPVLPDEDMIDEPNKSRRATRDAASVYAAGVVVVAPSGRVLLLFRSQKSSNGGTWGLPAGGVEAGEVPLQAAVRECWEETGHRLDPRALRRVRLSDDVAQGFALFATDAEREFTPQLNHEHQAYAWAWPDLLPKPLHPRLEAQLRAVGGGYPE